MMSWPMPARAARAVSAIIAIAFAQEMSGLVLAASSAWDLSSIRIRGSPYASNDYRKLITEFKMTTDWHYNTRQMFSREQLSASRRCAEP